MYVEASRHVTECCAVCDVIVFGIWLQYFQKEIRAVHEGDPDTLIQRALKIKLSHKKMKK